MTWLESQVRATGTTQLAIAGLIVAAALGTLAFNTRYLSNHFAGPYAIPREELLAAKGAAELDRYWVTLKPDRMIDTGADQVTVRRRRGVETGRSVTGHYHVGVLGEKFLLIRTHGEANLDAAPPLTGALIAAPEDFIDRLTSTPSAQPLRARFMPMLLDTGPFSGDAEMLMGGAGLAGGLALLLGLLGLYRLTSPASHAALQRLAGTSGMSLADASKLIEADIAAGKVAKVGRKARLTSSHLVEQGTSFNVRPLSDLLWAYPLVITKKMYGIIPTGKSHTAVLKFSDSEVKLNGPEPQVMGALRHLGQTNPWILLGYDDSIEVAYQKQRKELAALVADRRMQVMAPQAGADGQPTQQQQPPTGTDGSPIPLT